MYLLRAFTIRESDHFGATFEVVRGVGVHLWFGVLYLWTPIPQNLPQQTP